MNKLFNLIPKDVYALFLTHHVAGVGRGAVVDELVDDVFMSHERRDVDGSQARLWGGDDKIDMTSMGNIIFALQKYWGTFGFDTGSGKVKKMWSSFLCSGLRVAKRIAKNKEKK